MEKGMLKTYIPKIEDLWFRELFMSDEATMSYNHAYGGTIPFPKEIWNDWYQKWIVSFDKRFYRYLQKTDTNEFVGEIAYYYDEGHYIANIIIYAKYRGLGYGKEGLDILCECAKKNGIKELYDNIAIDNPSIKLFLNNGFKEEYQTNEYIMLKKKLN